MTRQRAETAACGAPFRLLLLALCCLSCVFFTGCGEEVAAGGVQDPSSKKPPPPERLDPADLIPADLDIVVRIDIARLRQGLGPAAFAGGLPGLEGVTADPLFEQAIERANVVWLAMRARHFEAGDRVVIVEGQLDGLLPAPLEFSEGPSIHKSVKVFERRGFVARAETAAVFTLEDRAIAFVSPAEVGSVQRLLRGGPDLDRGQPTAEGMISLDLRAKRLSPNLERKFPSIGRVIGGIQRIRGTATFHADGIRVDLEIVAHSEESADVAARFLAALRQAGEGSQYASLLGGIVIDQFDHIVHVKWTVPAILLLRMLSGTETNAPPPTEAPDLPPPHDTPPPTDPSSTISPDAEHPRP